MHPGPTGDSRKLSQPGARPFSGDDHEQPLDDRRLLLRLPHLLLRMRLELLLRAVLLLSGAAALESTKG